MMDPNLSWEPSTDQNRPLQEKQWVRRVREEGDRTAFKKIFHAYYKRLHGFARSYVRNMQDAEDIVQSVFLRIWAQRQSWDPPGTVKNYLFAAVRNEALNELRHQQIVDDAEQHVVRLFRELKAQEKEDEGLEAKQLRHDIEQAIDALPSRCREIFMLNRRSGLTYAEIAEVLDISVNTVSTQMGRALKHLRDQLSKYLYLYTAAGLFEMYHHILLGLFLLISPMF